MDEFEWGWICIDDNEMLVGCPAGGGGGSVMWNNMDRDLLRMIMEQNKAMQMQ